MRNLRALFSFPLLAKELTERAARPRTYWMRVGAALILYGGFWYNNDDVLRQSGVNPMAVLGAGEEMFQSTVIFLFICIYAFVPAMLCGVVTHEKERDSLVLLLLTRMRPWQIVLQKYLGGLIPGMTVLFLAMPLIAIAFAYGGVTTQQVFVAVGILILSILQIGAIAVWASCRCRTTVAAFLLSYFAGAAVFGLPPLFVEIVKELQLKWIDDPLRGLFYAHIPAAVLIDAMEPGEIFSAPLGWVGFAVIAATSLIFLLLAVWNLPRRAFVKPRNWLRRVFAVVDRWAHRANRWVGGVTFGRSRDSLPTDQPIVWREKRSRALARPEYLTRLLVAVMIPVVLLSVFFLEGGGQQDGLSAIVGVMSGLAVLVICTTAANGIVNERVNQTFEVLLTTSMSAAEILEQKARALRPLMWVLAIPILIVCAIEFSLEWRIQAVRYYSRDDDPSWMYPICLLLTLSIYLPLFSWLAIWIGLWCKTRIRAIVTTLIVVIVWIVGPIFVVEELDHRIKSKGWKYGVILSPGTVPILNEGSNLGYVSSGNRWAVVFANVVIYGGILVVLRRHCLAKADWYLRR